LEQIYGDTMIYDHWDPDIRNRVDLYTTPQEDESGREIRLYTHDSRKVPRRDAVIAEDDDEQCGILLNLRTVEALYTSSEPNWSDDENEDHGTIVSAYPQAFLHSYGHIQTNGIMSAFDQVIDDIRNSTGKRMMMGGNDEADGEVRRMRTVFGTAAQGYNELSHRVAPRSGAHDVQKGMITAALAGAYHATANASACRTAATREAQCRTMLPFDRFKAKIEKADCPRAFRMEQVYYVDIFALKASKCSGRYVILID
jgi:hypothetical protein